MFTKRTPNKTQRSAFGRIIRRAKKSRHLTQEDLAEAAGCSSHWVHQIECGKSDPNWVDALRFIVMLELDPKNILKEAGVDVPVLTDKKEKCTPLTAADP